MMQQASCFMKIFTNLLTTGCNGLKNGFTCEKRSALYALRFFVARMFCGKAGMYRTNWEKICFVYLKGVQSIYGKI